ncbi:hypothetical protein ACIQXA_08590 [Streptomyces massasporeus]|uniref:hypothetical protein n=1 Tax=Streptomyces massasporeus TaxID=67324 RepID=UPI0038011C74
MTYTPEQVQREQRMRAEAEAGFTDYPGFVGWVLCPAREKCPAGLRGAFKPLANGRLPMHRSTFGTPCPGAHKKPNTAPLQLRPAATPAP